ncbi:MAG: hypothetical protein ACLP4K_28800, partial [Mycobacterium sp.]
MAKVNIKPLEDKILVQANEAETTTMQNSVTTFSASVAIAISPLAQAPIRCRDKSGPGPCYSRTARR